MALHLDTGVPSVDAEDDFTRARRRYVLEQLGGWLRREPCQTRLLRRPVLRQGRPPPRLGRDRRRPADDRRGRDRGADPAARHRPFPPRRPDAHG